ncbi:MAG: ACT domain-containing protein [Bulleidia sp.]
MKKDFLIVNRKILPDYLDKVIYARRLLETHEVNTITKAVQMAGISRNTFYKYKDYVFEIGDQQSTRNAVLSITLKDKSGALSAVLHKLSEYGTSVLTISQAIPINGKANVLLSLDISSSTSTMEAIIEALKEIPAVRRVHLDAIE